MAISRSSPRAGCSVVWSALWSRSARWRITGSAREAAPPDCGMGDLVGSDRCLGRGDRGLGVGRDLVAVRDIRRVVSVSMTTASSFVGVEWSIRCGNAEHGEQHRYKKRNRDRAVQAATDQNHEIELKPSTFYARHCGPFVVESREVGPWSELGSGE